MLDQTAPQDPRRDWVRRLAKIGREHGFFHRLGLRHLALFVQEEDRLVLSFDRADALWQSEHPVLPLGFDMVTARQWSLLSLSSVGQTWFNEADCFEFLETLAEAGFFEEEFRDIVILAAGPDTTHAAIRAACLIPSAKLLLVNPVLATSAENAPFETRFPELRRRTCLDPGEGALTQLCERDAAQLILFDPRDRAAAAQATQLRGPNTMRVGFPLAGVALGRALKRQDVLVSLIENLTGETRSRSAIRSVLRRSLRRDAEYCEQLANRCR